ncbi:alpha/beta fold hydrolase [Methylobacterium sp. P31]
MAEDFRSTMRARLPRALDDAEFRAASRGLDARVRLLCGDDAIDLLFAQDESCRWMPADPSPADVTVAAAPSVWRRILAPVPPPRHQSFTALQLANPETAVSGDPLSVAQARPALERLFEVLRPPVVPEAADPVLRDLGQIVGRYAPLRLAGGTAGEVFFEAAGDGPPVVFLHTAGADARQFGAILSDVALAQRWRLLAFDCPFHGRSLPPLDWDGGAYSLDGCRYLGWVSSFLETVVRGPAILVGCSMGAAMVLTVAAERPDLLRGVIALEAPLRSPGRRNPFLAHAAVSGGCTTAPMSAA